MSCPSPPDFRAPTHAWDGGSGDELVEGPGETPFFPAAWAMMPQLILDSVLAAAAWVRNESLWLMWTPRLQMLSCGRTPLP